MKYIASRDNARYKRLRSLVEDARNRREEGASVIDGEHLIDAALQAAYPLRQLVLREDVVDSLVIQDLLERAREADPSLAVVVMATGLFNSLSPVVTPTGVLAEIGLDRLVTHEEAGDDVLALAGVQDSGNLGSLLRSARAAGIRRVWLDKNTANAWSPKSLRAGMGAQFSLVIEEGVDLSTRLTSTDIAVLVTSLDSSSVSLFELDLRRPAVWVFGSEGRGVPAEIQALASQKVLIPMPGQMESLNVAAAAAVCLFEQLRQRLLPSS